MARARNIKPGFFLNEELVELPFATRLLFIGLWTLADREGRLEDKPKRIKMNLFPADDVNVDEALTQLESAGFLLRYTHCADRFIQVLAFSKHQNPHRDEKASLIPAPCEHGASTVQEQSQQDGNRADSLIPDSLISDSPIDKQPAGKPLEVIYPDEFEQAWEAYPRRPGASKKDSYKAWNARLKGGVSPNVMIAGVQRYAAYVIATQTQEQFVKQPATFFGTGEHYLADWRPSPRASPNGYESAKDRERRETIEGLTGKRNERSEPTIIDIN